MVARSDAIGEHEAGGDELPGRAPASRAVAGGRSVHSRWVDRPRARGPYSRPRCRLVSAGSQVAGSTLGR
jgi:hypothetical protein